MKKLLGINFILFLVFATSLFPFATSNPVSAQSEDVNLTQIAADIDTFLGGGADAYLLWQYSGDRINPFATDPFSFFRGSPICDLLKQKAAQYPDKSLGVNMWDAGVHDAGKIQEHFNYLAGSCGVKVVRVWADNDARAGSNGQNIQKVLGAAGGAGIKIIAVLGDYSNGSGPHMPGGGALGDPTAWYQLGYATGGYMEFIRKIAGSISGNPNLYGLELANEPHCSGVEACVTPYVIWARNASQAIAGSGRIGIGQMGSHSNTRGDSPDQGSPSDYERSNSAESISISSVHFYTQEERALAQQSMGIALRLGKTFYVGEAGTKLSESGNADPFELNEIPCSATQEPEFHSLRPYPATPCNKAPDKSYYLCGQDLVVKEVLSFTRDDAVRCDPPVNGKQMCYFHVTSSSNVALGLANANFPIMGNTELVPNSTNTALNNLPLGDDVGFLTRLNEYASWYLNGVSYRAEEVPSTIDQIVNLSGPIKKLLPRDVQFEERRNEKDRVNVDRHNQIVSCDRVTDPQQCYRESNTYNRLLPPNQVPPNPNLKAFPYIPFSTTEDVVGEANANIRPLGPSCSDPVAAAGDPNISGVTCEDFTTQSATKSLYFPHILEVNELGQILQGTYKPSGVDDRDTAPMEQHSEQLNTKYCELLETRTNPGDRLYGELNRNGEVPIQGTVTYQANLQCEFADPNTIDNQCVSLCLLDPLPPGETDINAYCQKKCTFGDTNECQREIFIPFSITVDAPGLKTTWERFVAGSMSIVKRIFPQVGPNTPIDELKDIPGESNAAYSSANQGVSGGGLASSQALAGNPAEGRPGSTAKIFFPHIGSVYDYFLNGIQTALLPFGLTYETEPGATPPLCQTQNSGIQSTELLNMIGAAARWARVPVDVLITVARIEGRCRDAGFPAQSLCGMTDAEVIQYSAPGAKIPWNCPSTPGASKGPFQLYEDSVNWTPWKNAVNTATGENRTPEICNVKDSLYAAAYRLSASRANSAYCPQAGYNVGNTPAASTWSDQDRKWVLTRWAGGCNSTLCGQSGGPGAAFASTYCNYFDLYKTQIATTCDQ